MSLPIPEKLIRKIFPSKQELQLSKVKKCVTSVSNFTEFLRGKKDKYRIITTFYVYVHTSTVYLATLLLINIGKRHKMIFFIPWLIISLF